jgi:hypothetical protein
MGFNKKIVKKQQNLSQDANQRRVLGELTHVLPLVSLTDWVMLRPSFVFSLAHAPFCSEDFR